MATKIPELRRTKFVAREVEELNNRTLLEEAKQLFGYQPEALRSESDQRQHQAKELQVASALERLGIEPLDTQAVNAYKAAKIDEAVKVQSSKFVRYMHESGATDCQKGETVVVTLTILMIAAAVVSLASYLVVRNDYKASLATTLPVLYTALRLFWSVYLSAYAILMYARHKHALSVEARWHSTGLDSYRSAVPEFALARAVAVKKELPQATFAVEELEVSTRELGTQKHVPRPDPDPFLVLYCGGVRLYLDVWNEPAFEGRRSV